MSYVHKRKTDRQRGRAGKYTMYWRGVDGKWKSRAGFTDRQASEDEARRLEREADAIRAGTLDPAEIERKAATLRSITHHLEDYRLHLKAKQNTPHHVRNTISALKRLFDDAAVDSVTDISPVRIQAALGRLKEKRSARTCNHALKAAKTFVGWLKDANRIREAPPALMAMVTYNEEADRKRIRRALTKDEIDRLLAAAEQGPTLLATYGKTKSKHHAQHITGPERAALYRMAMGTGFRANELRTLTPERFELDGDEPSITVLAAYAKNGKTIVQPITRELAAGLRPFVAGRAPGKPVLVVPEKTAKLLRHDLKAANIPDRDANGHVVDFHALRHSYITHLARSGANPKAVQKLARHSTITLTLDRYFRVDDADLRRALEPPPKNEP